jgi:dual specificity tyrosine-phosphorylation-regulated kinase 2/3/4
MSDAPQPPRSIRTRPSMADESGGEEILYPRQSSQSEQRPLQHIPTNELDQAPPSDSSGSRSRAEPTQSLTKDAAVRKHRSLGVGPPPGQKAKDRRRDTNLTPLKESGGTKGDKHSRHSSIGSSSSHDHGRRVHTTDFSHLPPSPSTSSIHHLLKGPGNIVHSPSSVAQSLLRGTQEGWSGMDDEATVDALRKLDGLSSKSAHASSRVSTGGASRANSLSRPGTPAKTTAQWEGVDGKRSSRRISTRVESGSEGRRDSGSSGRNRTGEHPTEGGELHVVAVTSDDANGSVPSERMVRKTSARLSYNAKRASTSSTSHTSPTTSSRDSASLSASTSVTSISTASVRFPGGKPKRNSTDVHSAGESASDRERAGSGQDSTLEYNVPPVPPLPKGLSSYRSPPPSSSTTVLPQHNQRDHWEPGVEDEDADRTFSVDIPATRTPSKSAHHMKDPPTGGYLMPVSAPAVVKTPSKKWSFTNAFKLTTSPSSASIKDKHPGTPHSTTTTQVRKSSSKDRSLVNATSETWSPVQPDAMASATSLASLSSIGSPANAMSSYVMEDRASESDYPNRMESSASANTNTTSLPPPAPLSPTSSIHRGSASSKRLTPSSIPFFRRSSSQSMHFPSNAIPSSASPTTSSASYSGTRAAFPKSGPSPSTDLPNTSSLSTPSTNRKSSVLSLGIPSLLKGSSSRKSLHGGDKSDTGRDSDRDVNRSKQKEKEKSERSKLKKEEKERSESRISVLMGRKRGKVGNP